MENCPVCKKEIEPETVEPHGEYRVLHCPECDVVYSSPMGNPGSDWYENDKEYIVHNMINEYLPASIAWWHEQFLRNPGLYGRELFDIGCGSGLFLNEAKKLGYIVSGVDFNSESIRIAREKHGLDTVECMSADDYFTKYKEKKFDVVTFFDVLEHMEDPAAFMAMVRARLRPGGYVALSVPNRERAVDLLGKADYPPHHLTRWNLKAIKAFLEKNGFETVRALTKDLDLDDLIWVITAKTLYRSKARLSQKVAISSSESKRKPFIYRNYRLLKGIKNLFLRTAFLPVLIPLKVLRPQSLSIYCIARLKG